MEKNESVQVFWFRRDLRLTDNIGLAKALENGGTVLPIFIFDTHILGKLSDPYDRRVDYIHQAVAALKKQLHTYHSDIKVFVGTALSVFSALHEQYNLRAVYCNTDYEPAAIERDAAVKAYCEANNIRFHSYKDQVIFEKSDIVKSDGSPYTVYTPYSRKWKEKLDLNANGEPSLYWEGFYKTTTSELPTLAEIGFQKTDLVYKEPQLQEALIASYDQYRDFPALGHTSRLGIALRFGTISIRRCVAFAIKHNATWLNELIWREFFMQVLYHFPQVQQQCFKPAYERISWRNKEEEFKRWCAGETGYPLVDAGMRELNTTGFMHNRVRMVVASFLTKHLLIDWRWGEAYFAEKLLDYDLAANNGNWQWAAGCGCDAAPYFRVFNPSEQQRKFDKELRYVKQWNPDFETTALTPIVEHSFARERALRTYKQALK
ncbi:cryptochrome/photolyase family protein [Sphingobacterium sp. Mn56C]|uniref:cryptochrome/photolyase family protein n=1 Tax=Sphingobacterium sp. Mn56C TaxID=3395261 RepID=UPI003BC0A7DC